LQLINMHNNMISTLLDIKARMEPKDQN